ncbi:hypothetical protein Tco_1175946 [Tanacetum coccineum]
MGGILLHDANSNILDNQSIQLSTSPYPISLSERGIGETRVDLLDSLSDLKVVHFTIFRLVGEVVKDRSILSKQDSYERPKLTVAYESTWTARRQHIDVIDEILEEDFDALLDEGSSILYSIEGTPLEEKLFAEFDEFMTMNVEEDIKSDNEEPTFKKITFDTDYKIKTSLKEPSTDL